MIKSLREFTTAKSRRTHIEKQTAAPLSNIASFSFTEEQVKGSNIENLLGSVHVPLGVAGPIRIMNHESRIMEKKKKEYFIPLATTEGALVASVSRGCKAITLSGGATVIVEDVGVTRAPVFRINGIVEGKNIISWIEKNRQLLEKTAKTTSSHLTLTNIFTQLIGRNLFVRFSFYTGDAMGMNMATIATEKLCKLIEKNTSAKCISVAGNFDIDKKPAYINSLLGRGKKAWAEVIVPKKVVRDVLKTTPEKLAEVAYRKNAIGSAISGSLGYNAHIANIAGAIYIATGQDIAHVVEASLGITTAEVLENGDLYIGVYLPALLTATFGGGTHLPTQKEALALMGCVGDNKVLLFTKIVAGAILAGEISLIASQAEGTLAKSHERLGRKKT